MTTAYEKERLLNIQKNKERLQALGLLSGNENQGDGVSIYT